MVHLTGTAGEVTGHLSSGRIDVDLFTPRGELGPLPLASVESSSTRWPMGHGHVVLRATAVEQLDGDHRGHVGGDAGLMEAFIATVAGSDGVGVPSTGLVSALDSHWMAFAAEESRLTGQTVDWADYRRS